MHKKLIETFRKGNRPVLTEHAIHEMEKGGSASTCLTPLHGLYCDFKDEACGGERCFNNSLYYTQRCIPALCFARWLVLKGYAKFNFKELRDSTADFLLKEGFKK